MKELLIAFTVLLLGSIWHVSCNDENMSYMGNPTTPTTWVGNDNKGAVYMMRYRVQDAGMLFAFQGFFRNSNKTRYQIYRPVVEANLTFRLVAQWTVKPAVLKQREDVYIRDIRRDGCFVVRPGDRIAVLTYEVPGSAVFIFATPPDKDTARGTITLAQDDEEKNWLPLNSVEQFEGVGFPYEFALLAWIDKDLAKYNGGTVCRDDVNIPTNFITTPATPTGQPGLKGDPGPQGAKGDRGDRGSRGSQGPPGPKGDTGDSGSGGGGQQGPQGPRGFQGQKGERGEKGTRGDRGNDGTTGLKGDTGSVGSNGMTGPKGDAGPQGPQGPPGNSGGNSGGGQTGAQTDGNCMCGTGLLHPNLILGLIIWLLIVTILIIMIIILMTCQQRTDRDRDRVSEYRRDNPWLDPTMREDHWKEYTVDTISQ